MWIPSGVPDNNKWLNVCRCIDKLEKVNKKKEKIKISFFIFFDVFVFILAMWKGHFQPILLTGALDVTVIPMHNAWTQYSHVCFTLPRLQTCEHPIHIAFVSRLPSPHTLQRVESNSGEGPLCCLCFHRGLLLWRKRKGGPSYVVTILMGCRFLFFFRAT